MNPERRTLLFLEDIQEYAAQPIQFCEGVTEEEFAADVKLQFAVVRAIEVIGEACRIVPEETRNLAPEIPWRKIVTTRNIIAHHYFGLNLKMLWRVVQFELGPLIVAVERLKQDLPQIDTPGKD